MFVFKHIKNTLDNLHGVISIYYFASFYVKVTAKMAIQATLSLTNAIKDFQNYFSELVEKAKTTINLNFSSI